MTLSNGATAPYTGGTGDTDVTFVYTVAEGDTDATDLTITGFTGSMTDAAGGPAGLGAVDPGTIVIDGDTPDISSVSATAGEYGIGETVTVTVVFDEIVAVTGVPAITLSNGNAANYVSGTGSTDLLFSYLSLIHI